MNNVKLVAVLAACSFCYAANGETSLAQLAGKTDLSIRFIDSFEVMRLSKGGQDAQKELEKQRNELAGELQKDEQKLKNAAADFQAKAATLSEAARDKEQQRLVKMERDLKVKAQEYEETIKLSMQRITEKLARDVEEAVTTLAKEQRYDAVVDTMTGRVIFVADKVNVTGDIIGKVNFKHNQLAQNKKPEAKPTKATA